MSRRARTTDRSGLSATKASRSLRNGLISLVLLMALAAGIGLAIPGLHGVGRAVAHMQGVWLAVAVAL